MKYFVFLLLVCHSVLGQKFNEQFKIAYKDKDTTKQSEILKNWEKADDENGQFFVCYFNYFLERAKKETLNLSNNEYSKDSSFELKDVTDKKVGFLGSDFYFESHLFNKAIDWIDNGIKKYPKRLDMRFGKITAYRFNEDFPLMKEEIIKTLKSGKQFDYKWDWFTESIENGKEEMMVGIQDFQGFIYKTQNNAFLPFIREISKEVLEHFPQDVPSRSNIAITHMAVNEFDKALPYLQQAEKIEPKDTVVLNNIAFCYRSLKQKKEAKAYYQKLIFLSEEKIKKQYEKEIFLMEQEK